MESLLHLVTVCSGREEVAARAKVLRDRTIGRQERLCLSRKFKLLHPPLALADRLVGVFGAIVQRLMWSMFHTRQHLLYISAIALDFIGDNYPGHELAYFEELAEESLRGLLVPLALHQDVEDMVVLIDGVP